MDSNDNRLLQLQQQALQERQMELGLQIQQQQQQQQGLHEQQLQQLNLASSSMHMNVPPPLHHPSPVQMQVSVPPPLHHSDMMYNDSDISAEDIMQPPPLMSLSVGLPLCETDEVSDDGEVRLPQALEEALAFKNERAKEIGIDPETEIYEGNSFISDVIPAQDFPPLEDLNSLQARTSDMGNADSVIYENGSTTEKQNEEDVQPDVLLKEMRSRRRQKKKKKKRRVRIQFEERDEDEPSDEKPDVEVEYIQEKLDLEPGDPLLIQFARIFDMFRLSDSDGYASLTKDKKDEKKEPDLKKVPKHIQEDDDEELDDKKNEDPKIKVSKRKLKKLTRLSVAELKQLVPRPDVVEMHDVTARDPKLLVLLKAHRNTVPVPRHWCFKRKYLQGKRGIEKPPFRLPDFIRKTGIMEMRAALQEKEESRTLKARMRERVRPKMGKIDIDYQKLHDAFFKWQTKPRMTIHGDLYYEGKEFETRLKEKKPGELTDDLRTALGMPVGPNAHKVPPPWLIAMQRYGPPPSYPNLKIPGLNAPIPESCSFGYHAGGWGKPPVDEMGKPLYGDVFGIQGQEYQPTAIEEDVDNTLWGELESESEESESEEEEEEEEGEGEEIPGADDSGLVTPAEGLVTPSGLTSIPAGMETPEMIELRKRKIESEMEGGDTPALFTVLPERRVDRVGTAMMASTHVYDMSVAHGSARREGAVGHSAVELALDPSELDLVDSDMMAARYEQTLREHQNHLQKEDLSDMVAEHAAKQKNKRKRQAQQQDSKQSKKYKEFKF